LKRKDVKPSFIQLIWVLLTFAFLATIILICIKHTFEGDEQKTKSFWPYLVVTGTIVLVLVALAHWIFATYYLEVVLLLPLLMDHMQADLQKKRKRVYWIMNAANTYFYA